MASKIILDGKEYYLQDPSEKVKATLASIEFCKNKEQELKNIQALLQRAKNSYIESVKKEMLSKKSGFMFDEE